MSELLDNRAQRIATLKSIIRDLHAGVPVDESKRRLKELVRETDSSEIAAMEQELIAEGMPVAEVQAMCDVHAAVLREITVDAEVAVGPGHPIDTLRRENAAILDLVALGRARLHEACAGPDDALVDAALPELRHVFGQLWDVDKHYRRKENLIFSCLERHFIFGPSKVMWGKDDEVRELLKNASEALEADGVTAAELRVAGSAVLEPALEAIASMVEKEQRVLIPMTAQVLTEREWGEVWLQTPEYGFCLVEPLDGYRPPASVGPARTARLDRDEALTFATGSLDVAQLEGLLRMLPVDLTFVDADDRVRYFSEGAERVFARSKAIIGRKVQHCHPPKSVHVVEQILCDFRAGRQSEAEFWIEHHGAFVLIRYLAVRDPSGRYLGTLEVTQDLTHARALRGERRLLEYEPAAEPARS